MVTRLSKRVSRRVQIPGRRDIVVTIREDGIAVRQWRKRKTVVLPWDKLVMRALEHHAYMLNELEWSDPLKTLDRLARLRTRFHSRS